MSSDGAANRQRCWTSTGAAVQLDGKMVDVPVTLRAEGIMREVVERSAQQLKVKQVLDQ